MSTRNQVAARVRAQKDAHPEIYCPDPKCLWRTGGGYCNRHRARDSALMAESHIGLNGPKRGEIWEYHGMPCRVMRVSAAIATMRSPDGANFPIMMNEMYRAKGWIKQGSGWKSYQMGNKVICYER